MAIFGKDVPTPHRMALETRVPLVRLLEGAGGSVKSIESMGVSYVSEIVGWVDAVMCLWPVPGEPAIELVAPAARNRRRRLTRGLYPAIRLLPPSCPINRGISGVTAPHAAIKWRRIPIPRNTVATRRQDCA